MMDQDNVLDDLSSIKKHQYGTIVGEQGNSMDEEREQQHEQATKLQGEEQQEKEEKHQEVKGEDLQFIDQLVDKNIEMTNNDGIDNSIEQVNQTDDPINLKRGTRVRQKNRLFDDFHCLDLTKGGRGSQKDDFDIYSNNSHPRNNYSSSTSKTIIANNLNSNDIIDHDKIVDSGPTTTTKLLDNTSDLFETKYCRKCCTKTAHEAENGCQNCLYKKIVGSTRKRGPGRRSQQTKRRRKASNAPIRSSAQSRSSAYLLINDSQKSEIITSANDNYRGFDNNETVDSKSNDGNEASTSQLQQQNQIQEQQEQKPMGDIIKTDIEEINQQQASDLNPDKARHPILSGTSGDEEDEGGYGYRNRRDEEEQNHDEVEELNRMVEQEEQTNNINQNHEHHNPNPILSSATPTSTSASTSLTPSSINNTSEHTTTNTSSSDHSGNGLVGLGSQPIPTSTPLSFIKNKTTNNKRGRAISTTSQRVSKKTRKIIKPANPRRGSGGPRRAPKSDIPKKINVKIPERITDDPKIVDDLLPKLDFWTPDDTMKFLILRGFHEEACKFKEHSIDGMSLMLMQRTDFITNLQLKLGPALKVYDQVCKLKSEWFRRHNPRTTLPSTSSFANGSNSTTLR